jgi:hypothetical protein
MAIITPFMNGPNYSRSNDRFIIGCTGTFRLIDLLHCGFDPPKITEGFDRNSYMRRDFIPALRKYFKDHGLLETNNGVERFTGPFMVGFEAHLYIVQNDFSVLPAPPHDTSVGSGAEAAEAVLYQCRAMKMTAAQKLRAALEAAEGTICSVKGPFEFAEIGTLSVKINH